MKDPHSSGQTVERSFDRIHREHMRGIPILNPNIAVQTLGFQIHQGRIVGIVITPWLMSVVLLPADDEDWSSLALGSKTSHDFPSGTLQFMVNEIDGIGFCQTLSLHSPMNRFSSQDQALKTAEDFIDRMMSDPHPAAGDLAEEDPPLRVIPGQQAAEVNLNDFATIEPHDRGIPIEVIGEAQHPPKKTLDRRALLLGQFRGAD